jgi:hypothetical protein
VSDELWECPDCATRNATYAFDCDACGFERARPEPPEILRFSAAPTRLFRGQELVLEWSVVGVAECSIGGIGRVPNTGRTSIAALEHGQFQLQATNLMGTVTAVTDWVEVAKPPTIRSLDVPLPRVALTLNLDKNLLELVRVRHAIEPLKLSALSAPRLPFVRRRSYPTLTLSDLPTLPTLPRFF